MRIGFREVILALAAWLAAIGPLSAQVSDEETGAVSDAPHRVGSSVEGEVRVDSEVIHSPKLNAGYTETPVRGVRFAFEIEAAGPVTIDLRSYLFDTYLVLESAAGDLIAEDDDGLVGTQSRIVASLVPGRYSVIACALLGDVGPFVLETRVGANSSPEGPARNAAEIEDERRAVETRESVLGPAHPWTAISLSNLAGLYQSQGRYGEADLLYRRALECREASLGPEHPETATSLSDLADLCESQGLYGEAASLFERALEIRERVLGELHPVTASSLINLASLYGSQGRPEKAEPLYRRAMATLETALGREHASTAGGLSHLAALYYSQGRYGEAEPLYLRALKIYETALGENHPFTVLSLNNLGLLYYEQGRDSEAEALLQRALEIQESVFGKDHSDTTTTLNNMALLYKSQGHYGEAELLYLRALAIEEIAFGKEHPSTATIIHNLAALYCSQARFDDAEPLYLRVLDIWRSALGEDHPDTSLIRNSLALLFCSQGRYDEAEPLLQRALRSREATLGKAHPDTVTSLTSLAMLYDSRAQYERSASLHLRALDGGHSWIRRELARSVATRRFSIAGSHRNIVDGALTGRLEHRDGWTSMDEVYRRVCAWKGVVFRHVARLSRTVSAATGEDSDVRSLRSELADLEGRISVLVYAERIADPEAHKRTIAALRFQRSEVHREMLRRVNIEPEREATDGGELSRLLPEQTAVLDFLIHRPWRPQRVEEGEVVGKSGWEDPRLLCFVTYSGAGEPTVLDLGDVESIRAATKSWLDSIARGSRGEPPERSEQDPGEAVRALLLDPILAVIPADTTRLFVIPDDFLGQVPLGAIPIEGGRYVLEAVDVVYATDPVTLRDRLEVEPQGNDSASTIFAVGGVDYDDRTAAPETATLAAIAESPGGSRAFSRAWGPLPGTAEEVDGLSLQAKRTHSEAEPPRILKGSHATEEAVKTESPGKAILHFATHGFFERDGLVSRWQSALERAHESDEARGFAALSDSPNPYRGQDVFASDHTLEGEEPGLLAGLILAGANRDSSEDPDRDDGILTATEVAGLDLSACRLAVLSACQSSLGSTQSGEGLQSLRRGFQEAGAQSVIASLWKVDDEATQKLMHAFYEELWTNKRGVGDALRRARLKLLREKKDPYYWGAFTLSGEWR